MNVSITAPLFDLEGHVWLTDVDPDGLANFERRNSRTPTLDGLAAIPDFGYSYSDRTLTISWPAIDRQKVETVMRLAKTYNRLIVATEEGCFLGAPGPFSLRSGEAQIQILVEKRIDG